MWDTNGPVSLAQLPYARIVALYRDPLEFFPAEEREEGLHRTVQRLWPFGLCRRGLPQGMVTGISRVPSLWPVSSLTPSITS